MIKPRCLVLHALEEKKHTTLQRTLTILNLIKLYAKQGLKEYDVCTNNLLKKYFQIHLNVLKKLLKCEPAIFIYIPSLRLEY